VPEPHSTDAIVAEAKRIAEKAQKGRRAFASAVVLLFVGAVVLSAWAVVVNFGQDTVIDRLSACERDPKGVACHRVKRQSDEAQPVSDACIQLRKTGYPCPKPGSRAAREYEQRAAAGGDAQNPSDAGQQHVPGNGDTGVDPGRDGQQHSPSPTGSPSPAPSPQGEATRPSSSGAQSPPAAESPVPAPSLTDPVHGAVEGVTGTVESVVCPAGAAGIQVCD